MGKIIKWGFVAVASGFIIWFLYTYYRCKQNGEESGRAFECNPFSSEPEYFEPHKPMHIITEGKCYEVTDYGKRMNYRQVGLSQCGQSEMKRSENIEEAIYTESIR